MIQDRKKFVGWLLTFFISPIFVNLISDGLKNISWKMAFESIDSFTSTQVSVPLIYVFLTLLLVSAISIGAAFQLFRLLKQKQQLSISKSNKETEDILSDDALLIISKLARLDKTKFNKDEMLSWQRGKLSKIRLDMAISELINMHYLYENLNYAYGNTYHISGKARKYMDQNNLI